MKTNYRNFIKLLNIGIAVVFVLFEIGCAGNVFESLKKQSGDAAPSAASVTITSSNNNPNVALKGDTITLTVNFSEAINTEPTVTIFGVTITGGDAVASNGNLTWTFTYVALGTETEGTVPISITNYQDSAGQAGEDVTDTTDSSAVTFDSAQVSFTATGTTVNEGDGSVSIGITLTNTASFDIPIYVDDNGDGTATVGKDYDAIDSTAVLLIPANTLTGNISVAIKDDSIDEGTIGNVKIKFAATVGYVNTAGNTIHTITIDDDDDAPNVSFIESTTKTPNETTADTFNVLLSAISFQTVTVDIDDTTPDTSEATDAEPADYATTYSTAEVTSITVNSATLANYNGDYFTLYNGATQYDFWFDITGSDTEPGGLTNSTSIDISSDTTISEIAASISSGINSVDGFASDFDYSPLLVTHSPQSSTDGDDTNASEITVAVATQGTAGVALNEGSTTLLTFNPGQTEIICSVQPADDGAGDLDNEQIDYSLLNNGNLSNASLGAIPDHAFTIWDDDGTWQISVDDVTVSEDAGTATVYISHSGPVIETGESVSVDYTTQNGTAAAGSDYTTASGNDLTWVPGEEGTSKNFAITITNDSLAEYTETIYVKLSDLIVDDDGPTPLPSTPEIIDDTGIVYITNDDTSITITSAETLDCDPVDGYIDHYKVTFSHSVTDSTFIGYTVNSEGTNTSNWSVAGYSGIRLDHGSALNSYCGSDSANDAVMYIKFDPGSVVDTGKVPELTAVAATVEATDGRGKIYYNSGNIAVSDVSEQDKAGPYVYYAFAADPVDNSGVDTTVNGAGVEDTLVVKFSESISSSVSLSGVDLDNVFTLNNGHNFGAGTDISATAWTSSLYSNDTVTITFATNDPTVTHGDTIEGSGTIIEDASSNSNNPPSVASVLSPPTIDGIFYDFAVGPIIQSAEYFDFDQNGRIDHVKIVFDIAVNDSNFSGYTSATTPGSITNAWQVAGYNDVRLDPRGYVDLDNDNTQDAGEYDYIDFNGNDSQDAGEPSIADTANDSEIWLQFAESSSYDTGSKPDLTAIAGQVGLTALNIDDGRYCLVNTIDDGAGACETPANSSVDSTDVSEEDNANPVIVWASARVGEKYVYVKFSENVWTRTGAPACGSGGELKLEDFTYTDGSSSDASTITSVATIDNCAATDAFVKLLTDVAITENDFGDDIISATASQIYDVEGNIVAGTGKGIYQTTSPYVMGASSYVNAGKYYFRIAFSEPMDYTTATTAANYTLSKENTTGCADISATPLSISAVSSTVFDLESSEQCGIGHATNATKYRITVADVYNINNIEPVATPDYAITDGTNGPTTVGGGGNDQTDLTPPSIIEALSLTNYTVQLTYSEPMITGNTAASAECNSGYTVTCTSDVDTGVTGTQLKYTITPTLGNVTSVSQTANSSVYVLTHVTSQKGIFYAVTIYNSNSMAAIPQDLNSVDMAGLPGNQTTFQGAGTPVEDIDDGPMFEDPFADGSSFSFAFEYNGFIYLGPNDKNSGAYRFEADGANPRTSPFWVIDDSGTWFYTFGSTLDIDDTSFSTALEEGAGGDQGVSFFQGANVEDNRRDVEQTLLLVGPVKRPKVDQFYYSKWAHGGITFKTCSFGSSAGFSGFSSFFGFGQHIYVGIVSSSGKKPQYRKYHLTTLATGSSCVEEASSWSNDSQKLPAIGANAGNDAENVGIDSIYIVESATYQGRMYLGNNGGLITALVDETPDDSSNPADSECPTATNTCLRHTDDDLEEPNDATVDFSVIFDENDDGSSNDCQGIQQPSGVAHPNQGDWCSTGGSIWTLPLDPLFFNDNSTGTHNGSSGKLSPGQKGIPFIFKYDGYLFLARNTTATRYYGHGYNKTTDTDPRTGGQVWVCDDSGDCTDLNNWYMIVSTVTGQRDNGENANDVAISILTVNAKYLYIGFDNMKDGARIYRVDVSGISNYATNLDFSDFSEVGRVSTANCTNHSDNPGAIGGECYAYQFQSHAQADKLGNYYLYLTTGCTYQDCDNATGFCNSAARDGTICDMDGSDDGGTARTPTPIKVLVQKDTL